MLEGMLRSAQKKVNKIMRELVLVDQELTASMNRLEMVDAYHKISTHFNRVFNYPVHIHSREHHVGTPEATPLSPCHNGPAEMPILQDTDKHNRKKT